MPEAPTTQLLHTTAEAESVAVVLSIPTRRQPFPILFSPASKRRRSGERGGARPVAARVETLGVGEFDGPSLALPREVMELVDNSGGGRSGELPTAVAQQAAGGNNGGSWNWGILPQANAYDKFGGYLRFGGAAGPNSFGGRGGRAPGLSLITPAITFLTDRQRENQEGLLQKMQEKRLSGAWKPVVSLAEMLEEAVQEKEMQGKPAVAEEDGCGGRGVADARLAEMDAVVGQQQVELATEKAENPWSTRQLVLPSHLLDGVTGDHDACFAFDEDSSDGTGSVFGDDDWVAVEEVNSYLNALGSAGGEAGGGEQAGCSQNGGPIGDRSEFTFLAMMEGETGSTDNDDHEDGAGDQEEDEEEDEEEEEEEEDDNEDRADVVDVVVAQEKNSNARTEEEQHAKEGGAFPQMPPPPPQQGGDGGVVMVEKKSRRRKSRKKTKKKQRVGVAAEEGKNQAAETDN